MNPPKCKKCMTPMKPLFHIEWYCPMCEHDGLDEPKPKQGKLPFDLTIDEIDELLEKNSDWTFSII